jgi:hypothetical protein
MSSRTVFGRRGGSGFVQAEIVWGTTVRSGACPSTEICHAGEVPTAPSPTEGTPARPSMPPSVRVAVIVMGVLAALLLTNAALLWYAYDDAVARLVREGEDISRSEASQFVLMSLVPYLVIGLVLALAAWFLPRRQPWARWMGLAASGLLALLSLMSVVSIGGVTIALLLVLVLSVAAITSLLARTTGAWVPKLRTPA